MLRNRLLAVLLFGLLLISSSAFAETITKTFSHKLLVGQPSQTWEHRIDLPDSAMINEKRFIARDLDIRMGKLVIVKEEFTPNYYYIKVKLAKHTEIFMKGFITIKLEIGDKPLVANTDAPTNLRLSSVAATLKPGFKWTTKNRYAAISLYDLDTQKTVWERISVNTGIKIFDEPFFLEQHRYIWSVKVSDKSGRYSKPVEASFKIVTQDGIVIAIPD